MINFQQVQSWSKIYEAGKVVADIKGIEADLSLQIKDQNFQESLDLEMLELQSGPNKPASLDELKPLLRDESIFPAFLSDPVARGREKMEMVIYDKDGNTVGAVGESGIATFSDSMIPHLFKFGMDLNDFAKTLEKMGFSAQISPQGQGPTYAAIFNKMYGRFGISYEWS